MTQAMPMCKVGAIRAGAGWPRHPVAMRPDCGAPVRQTSRLFDKMNDTRRLKAIRVFTAQTDDSRATSGTVPSRLTDNMAKV
ncbi:hypothetical protein [Pseudogemmobacter sp. W21_MBD1_M6]|uniref:hypothetical protein n=1 Tax=Pseudogemmobacter sp. W21_MBD1_M6 TaxID=3240271 RepID=UPI003F9830A4